MADDTNHRGPFDQSTELMTADELERLRSAEETQRAEIPLAKAAEPTTVSAFDELSDVTQPDGRSRLFDPPTEVDRTSAPVPMEGAPTDVDEPDDVTAELSGTVDTTEHGAPREAEDPTGWPSDSIKPPEPRLWDTAEVTAPNLAMTTIPGDMALEPRVSSVVTRVPDDDESNRGLLVGGIVVVAALVSVVVVFLLFGVFSDDVSTEPARTLAEGNTSPDAQPDEVSMLVDVEAVPAVVDGVENVDLSQSAGEPESGSGLEHQSTTEPELNPEPVVELAPGSAEASVRIKVRFPGIFPPNSDRVSRPTAEKLSELIAAVEPCPMIRIIGHASTGGSLVDDEVLALARAEFVKEMLVDEGIAANRLRVQSAKIREPTADTPTEEDDARKRRVVLICKPR